MSETKAMGAGKRRQTQSDKAGVASFELSIRGMHCASCVQRIEKALLQTHGVTGAAVNLATESAKVEFEPALVDLDEIKRAIEATGYEVFEQPFGDMTLDSKRVAREKEYRNLRVKFIVGLGLAILVLLGSMRHWFPWVPGFLSNFYVL